MRNSKYLLVCLWLCGAMLPVSEVFAAAPFKLLGLDDMSCAAWKKHSDPETRELYVQWARGFLSGHNYAHRSRQVTDVSKATVALFIDRFCSEHASATVDEAAMRMSDQYSGRNAPIAR